MTEQEVKDGNKLIAEFMGEMAGRRTGFYINHSLNKGEPVEIQDLKYHSSWDWLMPVVEKIWKMGKMVSLNLYTEGGGIVNCKIYNWGMGDPYQETEDKEPIIAMWHAVVQFIQWYNNTQTKSNEQYTTGTSN